MKKLLSVLLAAVMIVTLSSSAIFAAPNNNPNASFNREKSSFENKVKNKTMNEGEEEALREQLRFTMLNSEGLPYGLAKRMELPPGLKMLFLRGTLPYGISKKLMDNYYPLPGKKTDLEVLETLIETADAKATVALPKDYEGGLTTIKDFKDAIEEAKVFVAMYDETKKAEIKTEIDKLRAAMKKFDDLMFMGPDELIIIKNIEESLKIYQDKYEDYLSDAKNLQLQNLIDFIETFTVEDSAVKLTKADYDSILMQEKAFKDPLIVLYNKITEAKVLLYKDITKSTLVFKETEGTDPGEYLPGSNVTLENAIKVAEDFVVYHTTQSLIKINVQVEAQVKTLDDAIMVFKGNEILGSAELSVVQMIIDILEEKFDKPYSTKLNTLITDLKFFVAKPALFTVSVYDDLLDRSQDYIDNLFDSIVLQIKELIDDAEDAMPVENTVKKLELVALIEDIEEYIDAEEYSYEVLVEYYNDLLVAYNAL